mgnify:CR=1 FL=1
MMSSGVHASHTDASVRGNESLPSPVDRHVGSARRPKLLDQMREALRSRHYSRRTEQTYCHWIKRSIHFHNVRHPAEMGEPEINAFLNHLAGYDIRTVQELLDHKDVKTTMIYTHVLNRGGKGVKSPVSDL